MKKKFFVLSMLLTTTFTHAQVTWNVKGGLGVSKMTSRYFGGDIYSKTVWKMGVGIETPLCNNLLFMPTIEFAKKATEIKQYDTNYTNALNYIQIPLLLAYRIPAGEQNFTIKTGPYMAYGLTCFWESKEVFKIDTQYRSDPDFGSGINYFDTGFILGAGYELHRLELCAEYDLGLKNILDVQESIIHNGAFYVTIGYKFR